MKLFKFLFLTIACSHLPALIAAQQIAQVELKEEASYNPQKEISKYLPSGVAKIAHSYVDCFLHLGEQSKREWFDTEISCGEEVLDLLDEQNQQRGNELYGLVKINTIQKSFRKLDEDSQKTIQLFLYLNNEIEPDPLETCYSVIYHSPENPKWNSAHWFLGDDCSYLPKYLPLSFLRSLKQRSTFLLKEPEVDLGSFYKRINIGLDEPSKKVIAEIEQAQKEQEEANVYDPYEIYREDNC